MKKAFYFCFVLLILLFSFTLLLFVTEDEANRLTSEDGFIQDLAAVFWILAAMILFYIFYKSKSEKVLYFLKMKRNIFLLLLALFFVFCCGEEISWGQRIFGIKTSNEMQEINAQKETNLHNLWIFQSYDKELKPKSGLNAWYTSARIFAIIWLLYCVFIPLANKYSLKARNLLNTLNLPVIPIWIGFLFLMNHFISRFFENLDHFRFSISPVIETKETNFAFLFLVASISLGIQFLKQSRKRQQSGHV